MKPPQLSNLLLAISVALTAALPGICDVVAESSLSDPAMQHKKLSPSGLYIAVFSWLYHKYQTDGYGAMAWAEWEHRFDGKINTEAEALNAINQLISNQCFHTELFSANKARNNVSIGCDVNNAYQVPGYFVDNIVKDSPAARAGIHINDHIKKVNSVDMSPSMTKKQAQDLLSGPPGSTIIVQVRRIGADYGDTFTDIPVKIGEKQEPDQPTFCTLMKGGSIAYLRPAFPLTPSKLGHLKTALMALNQTKASGIILDLRSNAPEMSADLTELCGFFVGSQPSYGLLFRGKVETKIGKGPQLTNLPMVALIDDSTNTGASALAACLKTNKRATLIGEATKNRVGVNEIVSVVTVDRDYKLQLPTGAYTTCEDKGGYQRCLVEPDIQELVYATEIMEGPWWNVSIDGKAPSPLDGKDVQLDLALNEIEIKSGISKGPRKKPRRDPPKPKFPIVY